MAVGRSGEFFEDLHPPVPGFFATDGELERGFAAGAAPDRGAREEPLAEYTYIATSTPVGAPRFQLNRSGLEPLES